MVWVINSNSNTCRIYQYSKPTSKLDLIHEITHPDIKELKTSDMVTDKPGKFRVDGKGRGAYAPTSDPKEIMIDNFLRDIAQQVNLERGKNSFDKIILIAPPKVEGVLNQHMDKHVKDMIICNIQKDLLHLNVKELLVVLKDTPNY